jgi:hypothetical protein
MPLQLKIDRHKSIADELPQISRSESLLPNWQNIIAMN